MCIIISLTIKRLLMCRHHIKNLHDFSYLILPRSQEAYRVRVTRQVWSWDLNLDLLTKLIFLATTLHSCCNCILQKEKSRFLTSSSLWSFTRPAHSGGGRGAKAGKTHLLMSLIPFVICTTPWRIAARAGEECSTSAFIQLSETGHVGMGSL